MRAGVPCCLRNGQPRDTKGIAVVSKGIARCCVSTWAEQCWARPEQWPGQARLAVESMQGSESGAGAAGGGTPGCGGLRQLGSQDRSGTGQSLLTGNIPVQADDVPVEPEQGLDRGAEVALPLLRCGSRVKSKVIPYQAGSSGMG